MSSGTWSFEFQKDTGLISFCRFGGSISNNVQIRLRLFHNNFGLVLRYEQTPRRCVFFPHCRVRRGRRWRWVFQLRRQRRQHQQRSDYYQPRQLVRRRGRDRGDNRQCKRLQWRFINLFSFWGRQRALHHQQQRFCVVAAHVRSSHQ